MREKQADNDPGERRRQSRDDDKRIEPGLKIDHNQQIDQHDGKAKASEQTDIGRPHRLELATNPDEAATRQELPVRLDNPREFTTDGAKVPVLDGSVHVHNTTDVVV